MPTDAVLSYQSPQATRRVGRLAILLLCMLGTTVLSIAGNAVGMLLSIRLWRHYEARIPITAGEGRLVEELVWGSYFAIPVGIGCTFILFLCWTYLAHKRLCSTPNVRKVFSPKSVIFVWFLPRSWYIRPYEAMRELYLRRVGWSGNLFTPLVGAWWALWLISLLIALTASFAARHRESGESDAQFAIDWATWNFLPLPTLIGAGVLLMAIIFKIDRGEKRGTIR